MLGRREREGKEGKEGKGETEDSNYGSEPPSQASIPTYTTT